MPGQQPAEVRVKDAAIIFACYTGLFVFVPVLQQLVILLFETSMQLTEQADLDFSELGPLLKFLSSPALTYSALVLAVLSGLASFLLFKKKASAYAATMVASAAVLVAVLVGTYFFSVIVFDLQKTTPMLVRDMIDTYIIVWLASVGHYAIPFVFVVYQFQKYDMRLFLQGRPAG